MTAESDQTSVQTVRALLAEENRRLLGATIAVEDSSWRAPSRLPGWTRGHVATHLARNADALRRVARGARAGTDEEMYPDDRDAEIEAGAARDGVELQTDLDRTAEALHEEFEQVAATDAWGRTVRLRGGFEPTAAALPAARLTEVVLHQVDLDLGHQTDDIDHAVAAQCLSWCATRLGARSDFPALRLITEDTEISLGDVSGSDTPTVVGPANRLLGWLTGRSDADGLEGATEQLPSFG